MTTSKYLFEIDHAGEAATVRFTIAATSKEKAEKYARMLNPSVKLIKIETSQY